MKHPLQFSIFLLVAVVLYMSLGVFFYTPETGFSWLIWFFLATVAVGGGVCYALIREAKKHGQDEE